MEKMQTDEHAQKPVAIPSIPSDHHPAMLCLHWSGLVGWKGRNTPPPTT